ncbi:hypothetical protein B974_01139 [Brucella abortus 87/28]|nr:hypothetical protein C088_01344 [Brucella abortus 65/110]ENP41381.1 hypothetical protein C055_01281 [Brucella abortus 78/36]ENQ04255.1 hypothetical protein C031_01340 [Brucella abortus F6/05-2]ENS04421.1 hypothetical protein B974_01139 [Brucella abortus 87/28]ENS32294.1 hypothetical protein C087_01386 [Brucella abortus F6/05-9]
MAQTRETMAIFCLDVVSDAERLLHSSSCSVARYPKNAGHTKLSFSCELSRGNYCKNHRLGVKFADHP